MASDRIQRQIDRFLDEAEDAVAHGDWGTAKDCAEKVFAFDPENSDGLAFLSAAARSLGGTEATPPGVDHSGMRAAARDDVQERFLSGKLEVIVATIAFGMGIDKADVRTVVHFAIPGSVEGYYQEIGRAGRDGAPSRAVLFYGWADRRTHEFFLGRDYPAPSTLARVHAALREEAIFKQALANDVHMSENDLDAALEKLSG